MGSAGPGGLSFYSHARHRSDLRQTQATAVLLHDVDREHCPAFALVCEDPYLGMARVLQALYPTPEVGHAIHPTAIVDETARLDAPVQIGAGCVVGARVHVGEGGVLGPHCVLGTDVTLGAACRLHARVTLHDGVQIGERVEIWSGAVVGADGFGYAQHERQWVKLVHRGSVRIGADCEIGANTTIDRGMLDDTVVGRGVKIDNQVQIAHNVQIGDHSAIAGNAGIAGSARLGRYCQIGGAAGVQGHVELADGVIITGMSKANQTLTQPGAYSSGTAIQENGDWLRNIARFKQLDRMVRALKEGGDIVSDGFDIQEIQRLLPHRHPFLLVDRVLEIEPGESIRAVKNITVDEPCFQGHFPGIPIFPGVLILEALAQASGLLVFKTPEHCPKDESLYMYVGVDKARFKKPVIPGDQLLLEARLLRMRQNCASFDTTARVGDEVVAAAQIMCMFKELPAA